ncbi:hypothetical protein JCM10213v2_000465 [Rhodosporidiobolus nylandii]
MSRQPLPFSGVPPVVPPACCSEPLSPALQTCSPLLPSAPLAPVSRPSATLSTPPLASAGLTTGAPFSPSPSAASPHTDAGAFTPVLAPSTAFTTPGSSKSLWGVPSELRLVGEGAQKVPTGFELLDGAYKDETGATRARSFEWEAYEDASSDSSLPCLYKRRLGPTEMSYYLGSRGEGIEGGVNDMYLHLGFKARADLTAPERILDAWTEVVRRHALLASSVEFVDYYDARFCYEPPRTAAEARIKAASLLDMRTGQDGKAYLDAYLNGPRTLSDQRLAALVISTPAATFAPEDPSEEQDYDLFLLSTHFLGDGMALHTTANEFFTLLGSSSSPVQPTSPPTDGSRLAPAMENKLLTPAAWGKLGWSAARVEYERDQAKLVGGHAFPRARLGTRKTLVPTVSYDAAKTKKILAACKARGVTIAHASFALSAAAFVKSVKEEKRNPELPVMIYSALNVRPYLQKEEADWYAIAIVSASDYFWHQALSVKRQTTKAVKSPFLGPRTALMALERERRSIGFERADEAKRAKELAAAVEGLQGLGIVAPAEESGEGRRLREAEELAKMESEKAANTLAEMAQQARDEELKAKTTVRQKASSTALMGLSMLGNLDGMYKHAEYPGIKLHTLTTGSRQRPGALLLFAYTFAGKLWLSLGYDSHGFESGSIEGWWDELLKGVDEFLLAEESQVSA